MTLEQKLKELRAGKGWSLTRTAKKLNVSLTTYREWEAGRRPPIERLIQICALYTMSISELLGQKTLAHQELAKAIELFEGALSCLKGAMARL